MVPTEEDKALKYKERGRERERERERERKSERATEKEINTDTCV